MKSSHSKKSLRAVSVLLIILACSSIALKLKNGWFQNGTEEQKHEYQVSYNFDYSAQNTHPYYVKALVPKSNNRQTIKLQKNSFDARSYAQVKQNENRLGIWEGSDSNQSGKIEYSFSVETESKRFTIDQKLPYGSITDPTSIYVQSSEYIESDHPRIEAIGNHLLMSNSGADDVLAAIFKYAARIPSSSIKDLTSAIETLDKNEASCNGKSRLFVALCRNLDIPARVSGGLVLRNEKKRTSHLWAEVLIQNQWVPFDALNGHYAYLPANFLEVYKGDEFLVRRSSNIDFDYNYHIASKEQALGVYESFNLYHIAKKTGLSEQMLSLLMLLPLGALLVAIFRNVIGMKTFGVFLPILIAISFTSTGLVFGLISFVGVLLIISLMHYPMLKWGVLHVPKLVVMLSGVVFLMIVLLFAGMQLDISDASNLTFFPIVILTISAEKYARIVVEEGVATSTKILFQTMLVTLFCFVIVRSETIHLLIMNFPEILLLIAVGALALGKWIGLRIAEYKRFGWILS